MSPPAGVQLGQGLGLALLCFFYGSIAALFLPTTLVRTYRPLTPSHCPLLHVAFLEASRQNSYGTLSTLPLLPYSSLDQRQSACPLAWEPLEGWGSHILPFFPSPSTVNGTQQVPLSVGLKPLRGSLLL